MKLTVDRVIKLLGLIPLDFEGGYYRETYRSNEEIPQKILPERYNSCKSFGTAIYYLLSSELRSVMHRVPTDEIFHFYLGDPVEMLLLYEDRTAEIKYLGTDIENGHYPQVIEPKNTWQGSRMKKGGEFALMGTTLAPGFDFPDLEIGDCESLTKIYPAHGKMIRELT